MITVGRIVHYVLTDENAEQINRRRRDALSSKISQRHEGTQVHYGVAAAPGDALPAIVVAVDTEHGTVNLQVFLNGSDTLWVYGIKERQHQTGYWTFPPRVLFKE